MDFVAYYDVENFFEMDNYDVYVGKRIIDPETFISSRC